MLRIMQATPNHLEIIGKANVENTLVPIESLNGPLLDYAVALAILDSGVLVLHFLPSGFPYQIRYSLNEENCEAEFTEKWSPSTDENLRQKIINQYLSEAPSKHWRESLHDIVRSKFGDNVGLLKLAKR